TDELITVLARLRSPLVISRTSVMRFKGSQRPLPEIARALNVDAVVEGSVLRSGDRIRISAQLVQAATDRNLWAGSYEGAAREILALESRCAQAIASQVHAQLSGDERARL